MKKIKLTKLNKITLTSITILLITNPWSVGYIDYAIEVVTKKFIEYSIFAFVASIAVLIILTVVMMYRTREVTKIPKTKSLRKV